jgi:hypothetical protein
VCSAPKPGRVERAGELGGPEFARQSRKMERQKSEGNGCEVPGEEVASPTYIP